MAIPTLLTKQEAAERARVSLVTFRKLIHGGTGPRVTQIGAKDFIREDELAAWLDRRTGDRPLSEAAA